MEVERSHLDVKIHLEMKKIYIIILDGEDISIGTLKSWDKSGRAATPISAYRRETLVAVVCGQLAK